MYWDDKYGTHSVSSEVCFAQSFNFNSVINLLCQQLQVYS
jgi:hypothetical protein